MASAGPAPAKPAATAPVRKKNNNYRTLGSLLRHFVGYELRVELKTGRLYCGQLESSDDTLSVTLVDATVLGSKHYPQQQSLSLVSIRGSLIRYIHFPDDLDLNLVVKQSLEREAAARKKYQRVTRK